MPDRDIVDAIDELVDWQLSNYENRSGYDRNVNQVDCPHPWCREPWHGLAITRRMQEMRWGGQVDPAYRYADDTSEVLCPGSEFDGEFTPPEQPDWSHTKPPTVNEMLLAAWSLYGDLLGIPDITGLGYDDGRPLNAAAPWAHWSVPDDPMSPNAWLAEEPRWWRCDDLTGLDVRLWRDNDMLDLADFTEPDRVCLPGPARHCLIVNGEQTELFPDRERDYISARRATSSDERWVEIHAGAPPRAGVWRPMHGVLDLADVAALQNLRYTAHVGEGVLVRSDIVVRQLQAEMQRVARVHFPGVVIHRSEMVVQSGRPTPPEAMIGRYPTTAQWVPKPVGGVLEGGHAHGTLVSRNVERVETVAPARFTAEDWRDPTPTVELNRVTYERAAYDTVTRRWVYRPRQPRLTFPPGAPTVRLWREDPDPQGSGWQELGTVAGPIVVTETDLVDHPPIRLDHLRRDNATVTLTDINPDAARLFFGEDNPAAEPAEGDQAA